VICYCHPPHPPPGVYIHLIPTHTFATADPTENIERHIYCAILPIRTVTTAAAAVAQHCDILL